MNSSKFIKRYTKLRKCSREHALKKLSLCFGFIQEVANQETVTMQQLESENKKRIDTVITIALPLVKKVFEENLVKLDENRIRNDLIKTLSANYVYSKHLDSNEGEVTTDTVMSLIAHYVKHEIVDNGNKIFCDYKIENIDTVPACFLWDKYRDKFLTKIKETDFYKELLSSLKNNTIVQEYSQLLQNYKNQKKVNFGLTTIKQIAKRRKNNFGYEPTVSTDLFNLYVKNLGEQIEKELAKKSTPEEKMDYLLLKNPEPIGGNPINGYRYPNLETIVTGMGLGHAPNRDYNGFNLGPVTYNEFLNFAIRLREKIEELANKTELTPQQKIDYLLTKETKNGREYYPNLGPILIHMHISPKDDTEYIKNRDFLRNLPTNFNTNYLYTG